MLTAEEQEDLETEAWGTGMSIKSPLLPPSRPVRCAAAGEALRCCALRSSC